MANKQPRYNKDGKLISYSIRVYRGRDADGKMLKPYTTTFKVKDTWSESTAEKKAEAFARDFERDCLEGKATDNRQTFHDYAEYVLREKEKEGVLKKSTLARYRDLTRRIYPEIGAIKLKDLRPQHLTNFYGKLQELGNIDRTAKPKPALSKVVDEKRLGLSAHQQIIDAVAEGKKVSRELIAKCANISSSTVSLMLRGNEVKADKAEAVAMVLGYKTEQLFKIIEKNKNLSAKTINEYHGLISSILAQAEKEMLVPYNAASKAILPKIHKKEVDFYQPEQIEEIKKAFDKEQLRWRVLGYMLIYTGARRGEILGLHWTDIDFENRQVCLRRNVLYNNKDGVYIDTLKNESSVRLLYLPQSVIDMLVTYKQWQTEEIKRLNGYRADNGYVFSTEKGEPLNPGTVASWLERVEKKNGLPHLHSHAFRHSLASALFGRNVDPVTISKTLGHAQVSTTENIYAHIIEAAKKRGADILEDVYNQK